MFFKRSVERERRQRRGVFKGFSKSLALFSNKNLRVDPVRLIASDNG